MPPCRTFSVSPPLDLARAVRDVAPEPYRAAQIAKWIYERRARTFSEMSNLPKAMREELAKGFTIGLPKIVARTPAPDGTEKFLFELADGARIEAVYIVESKKKPSLDGPGHAGGVARHDLPVVPGGLRRGLRVLRHGPHGRGTEPHGGGDRRPVPRDRAREKSLGPHEANVVFMGMGEPLLNVGNVTRALDLLEDEVSPRRTTVSTAGVVPGSRRSRRGRAARTSPCLSRARTTRRGRGSCPSTGRIRIAELFAALKRWPLERGRRITFEWVLIAGVNDRAGRTPRSSPRSCVRCRPR